MWGVYEKKIHPPTTSVSLHGRDGGAEEDDLEPLAEAHAAALGKRRADGQVAHLLGLELEENDEG